MSYDLDVYLSPAAQPLPEPVEGLGWQIAIYPPTPIDAEDMHGELLDAISGRTHLVNVHLEGMRTDRAEETLYEKIEQFVLYNDAVVHDLQLNTLTSQSGIRDLVLQPPKPKPTALILEWTYQCAAAERGAARSHILDIIEAHAPKAMPRRYGGYEPLPYTYAETGREHLLKDWAQEEWSYIWRGTAPYQWCFHHAPIVTDSRPPTERERFEWCSMSLFVSQRILKTKKDKASMLALFAALSTGLNAVYADIVAEKDRCDFYTGYGLPGGPALARVIGPAYAPHWPEFVDGATACDEHFVRDSIVANDDVPVPPKPLLAAPLWDAKGNPLNAKRAPAQVFPFKPLS